MNTRNKHGLRERLPMAPQLEEDFRWRGKEVSRIEGFTDAVFAFAVTLLVVAIEGPRTFQGLLDVVRGFPAFVICFVLLMIFWNAHYRYYRRFGLDDPFTRIMTMGILVLVLFFVYPLKFLFTMVTVGVFGLNLHDAPHLTSLEEVRVLYLIYGLGFAGAWSLYALLYVHALRKRVALELTVRVTILTRAAIGENLVYVSVCLLSIALAYLTPYPSLPGYIYVLLGPLQTLNHAWFGRQVRAAPASAPKAE